MKKVSLPAIEIEITADPSSATAGLGKLEKAQKSLDAATATYQSRLAKVESAIASGLTTQAKAAAAIDEIENEYLEASAAAAKYVGATAKVRAGSIAVGAASNTGAHGVRNIALQLNQVGQQAAVTGNFLQALIIQAPDMLAGFGGMKVALIGAAVGLGAYLIPELLKGKDAAKEAEEAIETFKSSLENFKTSAAIHLADISELEETYGSFAAAVQEASAAVAKAELAKSMRAFRTAAEDIDPALGKLSELQAEIDSLQATIDENSETGFVSPSALGMIENLKGSIGEVAAELGLLPDEAVSLYDALEKVRNAKQIDQVGSAAADAIILINGMEGATDFTKQALSDVVIELGNIMREASAAAAVIESAGDKAGNLSDNVDEAAVNATSLATMSGLIDFVAGANSAAEMRDRLAEALAIAMQMPAVGTSAGGGRGGDPNDFGGGFEGWQSTAQGQISQDRQRDTYNEWRDAQSSSRKASGGGVGGGAKAVNPLIADLESVQEALATETELLEATYAEQMQTLESAREQGLISQEEYQELSLRSNAAYLEAMAAANAGYMGDALSKTATFFGDMASAFASGNEEMLAISQSFAEAEAFINAWRAYSQTIASPEIPWYGKLAAGANVLAAGMNAVNAIKGATAGSSGTSGSSGSGTSDTTTETQTQNFYLDMSSGTPMQQASLGALVDSFNEAGRNGMTVNIKTSGTR